MKVDLVVIVPFWPLARVRQAADGGADVLRLGRRIGGLPDRRAAVGEAVGEQVQQAVASACGIAQAGERGFGLFVEINVAVLLA